MPSWDHSLGVMDSQAVDGRATLAASLVLQLESWQSPHHHQPSEVASRQVAVAWVKGHRDDSVIVLAQGLDARVDLPHLQALVRAHGGQPLGLVGVVRARPRVTPGQGVDSLGVALQLIEGLLGGACPDLDESVLGGGGQHGGARIESNAGDLLRVGAEVEDWSVNTQVPEGQVAVGVTGYKLR